MVSTAFGVNPLEEAEKLDLFSRFCWWFTYVLSLYLKHNELQSDKYLCASTYKNVCTHLNEWAVH